MPRSSIVRHSVALIAVILGAGACEDPGGLDLNFDGCLMYCGIDVGPMGYTPASFETRPTPVAGGLVFASISTGVNHTCGATTGGETYCWGETDVAPRTFQAVPSPRPVAGGMSYSSVSAGEGYSCGIVTDGRAFCWGTNDSGALGNGTVGTPSSVPGPVEGSLRFTSISVGSANRFDVPHACALTTDGAAYCWGSNIRGQLGNGETIDSPRPVAVVGGHTFVSIAAGNGFTCAIVRKGDAYCWGSASDGELGASPGEIGLCHPVSQLACSTTPVLVPGKLAFRAITAGGGHACGVVTTGEAYCWGVNLTGQVGNGATTHGPVDGSGTGLPRYGVLPVAGGLRFTTISAGTNATCALTVAGEAYCWGFNFVGQLGDGTLEMRLSPARVATDTRFTTIAAGDETACALTADGAAWCWGSNVYGKLGKGS